LKVLTNIETGIREKHTKIAMWLPRLDDTGMGNAMLHVRRAVCGVPLAISGEAAGMKEEEGERVRRTRGLLI
jgi:hypothetical protein